MASSTTPSTARVLPIASKPDSVMAAVRTNASMTHRWCKTLAAQPSNRSASIELEQCLSRVMLRRSGCLPMLSRALKLAHAQTRHHGCALPEIARVLRGLKSGTTLALLRAASLVTRSWDATITPPHIDGRLQCLPTRPNRRASRSEMIETRSSLTESDVGASFGRVTDARYDVARFSCAQIAWKVSRNSWAGTLSGSDGDAFIARSLIETMPVSRCC